MNELPKLWATRRLGDVAEVIMGQSPPGSTYNKAGNGVPFFQGKAEFGSKHPTVRQWTTAGTKFAQAGDVLMSVRAPVGPTNIAYQYCAIGRGLAAIRAGNQIDQSYLIWYLKHVEASIQSRGKGTTFDAISGNDLRDTLVNLPSLDEQKRIVEALDDHLSRLDKALAEVTATENHLIVLERSILQSLLGEGARDLEMVDFDEFFRVVQPRFEGYKQKDYQSHGALPIIDQGADLVGGYTDDTSRRNKVEQPLIVFGDHTRCVKYVDFDFALGADGTKMLEAKPGIDPRFAYWQLKSKELRSRGYARHMGELRKVSFWIPSPEDQRAITARIESSFEFVRNVREAISAQVRGVNTLRRSLLHMAFTGKLKGLVLDE